MAHVTDLREVKTLAGKLHECPANQRGAWALFLKQSLDTHRDISPELSGECAQIERTLKPYLESGSTDTFFRSLA